MDTSSLATTLSELRRSFDEAFMEAVAETRAQFDDLLAIRVRGDPYAIRLADIDGLFVERRIVPLPTPVPALLGLAGFRGQMVPVYELGQLLAYAASLEPPRWLVMAKAREPFALAFDAFDAQLHVDRAQLQQLDDSLTPAYGRQASLLAGAVRTDLQRPIVDLPALVHVVESRVAAARPANGVAHPISLPARSAQQ
jgi:purine-binding chemotaxis protein CheW